MRVHRSLPADDTAPGLARDALVNVASQVPPPTAEDLRLVLTELVTNAVKHANLRDGETIELNVRTRPEHVEAMVCYPQHVGFAQVVPLEPDEALGCGLFVVDQVSDRWSVVETQGQVQAWFEVDVAGRHPA
jgi:anti-sigma regulatory factor (Ser/Thr protein kinase)